MKALIKLAICFLPWKIKRWVLTRFFQYELHPTAYIGYSFIFPKVLKMGEGAKIDHLTTAHKLHAIEMGPHSFMGRFNWITGLPLEERHRCAHQANRMPRLRLGEHAAITYRHLIICTDEVSLGAFSIIGGFRSQIITHAADLETNRVGSAPVTIGDYSLIGSGCILLAGSSVPERCVVGAASLLNKALPDTETMYAGVPAVARKKLDKNLGFFTRKVGWID